MSSVNWLGPKVNRKSFIYKRKVSSFLLPRVRCIGSATKLAPAIQPASASHVRDCESIQKL